MKKIIKKKIVITGSSGYIGSAIFLTLKKNFEVFGIDRNTPKIKELKKNFYKIDLNQYKKLENFLVNLKPDLVIHLAAQSTIDFIGNKKSYIKNNIEATKNLLSAMKKIGTKKIIFSSTASVYKFKKKLNSFSEKSLVLSNNIYGKTKIKNEKDIKDFCKNNNSSSIILRFFNVCGASMNPFIGELHVPETHLIPIVVNKIINKKTIKIYGNNYNTEDGTCIRDYIHINDIVNAIKLSIKFLNDKPKKNTTIFNLGTNKGLSVLHIIKQAFKILKVNTKIKYQYKRKGDVPKVVCKYNFINKILGWSPKNSKIKKIILSEYIWQKKLKTNRRFIY